MAKKSVRDQYARSEEEVVKHPSALVSNAGYVCTEVDVSECINHLQELGYGGCKTAAAVVEKKVCPLVETSPTLGYTFPSCPIHCSLKVCALSSETPIQFPIYQYSGAILLRT